MSATLSPGGYVRQGSGRTAQAPRAVNVQVAVRCRPLNTRERTAGERSLLKCNGALREVHCSAPAGPGAKSAPGAATSLGKKVYTYDHVFGPEASQADVYGGVVEPIVDEVLQGYNCTVFAYGQTGTGKTHTMEGRRDDDVLCMAERRLPENAGIIPRSVKQIFDHLRSITDEHSVRVSHLELYNEQLTDLLGPDVEVSPVGDSTLRVYDDNTKGTFVQGLDEVLVRSEEEIFAVLDKSANKRRTAETLMNKYSSRSHSVFTITIHIKESTPDGADLLKVGKLNLVDLAGSENVGRSGAVRGRAREAGNINQSLLTLGRVITALVEKHPHVPYRDSKLTRLLQESLGGRNKTCIIATVTPGSSSTEETASTLDYAHRAKSIKNRPTVNQMIAKHVLLKEYTEEIAKIKRELEASRTKNGIFLPPDEYERLQATSKHQKDWITKLEGRSEEIEQQNEVLKDKLSRTQDALARTFKDLEQTKDTLATTEEELSRTESELAVAAQQRDESTHLVSAHVTAETQLYSEGVELTSAANRAVADVDALHTRIDARAAVEAVNMSSMEALQSSVSQSLSGVETRLQAFNQAQGQEFAACRESTTALAEGVANRLGEANAALSSLCREVRDLCVSQLADASAKDDAADAQAKSTFDDFKARGEGQIERAANVSKALDVASAHLGEALAAISADVTELSSAATNSFNAQGEALANFAGTQRQQVEQTKTILEQVFERQLEAISEADRAVESAVQGQTTAVRGAAKSALSEITNILNSFVQTCDESGENMSEASKTQAELLRSSVSDARTALDDSVVSGQKLTDEAVHSSTTAVQDATIKTREQAAGIEEKTSVLRDTINGHLSACGKDVGQLSSVEQVHLTAVDDHLASRASQRATRDSLWNSFAEAQGQLASRQTASISATLEKSSSDIAAEVDGLHGTFSSAAEATSAFTVSVSQGLSSEVGTAVDSFQLAVDEDASSAPPRRTWEYPTSLTTAASHEDLISSFREEHNLSPVAFPDSLPPRVNTSTAEAKSKSGSSIDEKSSADALSAAIGDDASQDSTTTVPSSPSAPSDPPVPSLSPKVEVETLVEPESNIEVEQAPEPEPEQEPEPEPEQEPAPEPRASATPVEAPTVLQDTTNIAPRGRRAAGGKPSAGNAAEAADAGAATKKSGLRPMTRRAGTRRRV